MRVRTRRKKDRPREFPFFVINQAGQPERRSAPIENHPTTLLLFKLPGARILSGFPYFDAGGVLAEAWTYGPSLHSLMDVAKKHGGSKGIIPGSNFELLA